MWRRTLMLSIALTTMLLADSSAQTKLKPIMREKVTNMQQLLEGVVTGDFVVMDRYGERLGRISLTEVASWQSGDSPDYLRAARSYIRAIEAFRTAVGVKNYEQAGTEYANLVSSCTACHGLVRSLRATTTPKARPDLDLARLSRADFSALLSENPRSTVER